MRKLKKIIKKIDFLITDENEAIKEYSKFLKRDLSSLGKIQKEILLKAIRSFLEDEKKHYLELIKLREMIEARI